MVFCARMGRLRTEAVASAGRQLDAAGILRSPVLSGDRGLDGDWLVERVDLIATGESDVIPVGFAPMVPRVDEACGLCFRGLVVAERAVCGLALPVAALCSFAVTAAALDAALAAARAAEFEGICEGETFAEGETFVVRIALVAVEEAVRVCVRGDLGVEELADFGLFLRAVAMEGSSGWTASPSESALVRWCSRDGEKNVVMGV